MVSFTDTLLLSAIMGLSIYLSMPIIMKKNLAHTKTKFLNAIAIGILIFLISDVFLDAAQVLYNGTLYGYGSSPYYDLIFGVSTAVGFFILFAVGHRRKGRLSQIQLALIIALGIAFQNLTEGLLFGSVDSTIGLTGIALVVLIGFIFQNFTEGFPIASPFLGSTEGRMGVMAGALFLGGFPTIIGGALGYYYNSTVFDLVFFGLAIGTMLYVILPMLRNLLIDPDKTMLGIAYAGVFIGFILGFAVNLL
ncbi:MAG: hypothetical protein JRN61_05225 [Nitrososphaerota archaeon]|nr:hypothetical protein [Nitrososphaerota archaeon]